MNEMPGSTQFNAVPKRRAETVDGLLGAVFQIAGSSSQVLIDAVRIGRFADNPDPCMAMAGQVGSQVKMRVGTHWLIANVRAMALDRRNPDTIIADIDFLGEGDEERLTGKIFRFRRGVTRYPTPGTEIFAVST